MELGEVVGIRSLKGFLGISVCGSQDVDMHFLKYSYIFQPGHPAKTGNVTLGMGKADLFSLATMMGRKAIRS